LESLAGLSAEQKKAAQHILNSRDTGNGNRRQGGNRQNDNDARNSRCDRKRSRPARICVRSIITGFKKCACQGGIQRRPNPGNAPAKRKASGNDKGQVLWIDEAGLVSSKDMRRLMDGAKKNGNRVILSGDYTQHSSVEAGDAFRLLEKEAGVKLARLTEIRRQTVPGYKKAVEAIAMGSGKAAQKGFDALDKMGWVVEASGEDRHQMLVKDYLKAQEEGKTALIIDPTHAGGQKITNALRAALKERGALGKEHQFIAWKSTGWTDAQKGDEGTYEPGMTVQFHQNAKGFVRAEKCVVGQNDTGLFLQKTDGSCAPLPVTQTNRFDVFRTREIAIAKGDRIRITKNGEAKVAGQAKGSTIKQRRHLHSRGLYQRGRHSPGERQAAAKEFFTLEFGLRRYQLRGPGEDG
jgi:hypothetical protein